MVVAAAVAVRRLVAGRASFLTQAAFGSVAKAVVVAAFVLASYSVPDSSVSRRWQLSGEGLKLRILGKASVQPTA